MVTNAEISSARDLVGKKIAISDIRSSPYYFARAGLKKLGLDEKQVGLLTTGGTANSFATLTSNQVVGAVLSPPFDEKAVSLGYKKFLFLGDLADIPYVGLFTSQSEIRTNRERIRKTIAAVMDAVAWQRANRAETVRMIEGRFKISRSEADRSYETIMGILSPNGAIDLKKVRGYLTLLRDERPLPENLDAREISRLLDVAITPLVCFDNCMRFVATAAASAFFIVLFAVHASAATDQVEQILKEQTKARQEEKAKAAQRQEQIENLKRDQESQRQQQQLDQIKNQKSEPSQLTTTSRTDSARPRSEQKRSAARALAD